MPQGLSSRLRAAFVLQAVAASVAIVLGILLVGLIVRELTSAQRMRAEASAFWEGRAAQAAYPLPHTSTVDGWFVPAGVPDTVLPDELQGLQPGISKLPGQGRKVLVERRQEGTLILSMSFDLVERVILWTGLASILLALGALYVVTWMTYRASQRVVAPVSWLAGQVGRWDPGDPAVRTFQLAGIPDGVGSEVRQLGDALRGLSERLDAFVQREQDFTRDASHELRTPLTVIRVATDLMLADPDLPVRGQRSLARVQRAGRDMESVIDAFLILAREDRVQPSREEFDAGMVIGEEVEKARSLLAGKPVTLMLVRDGSPRLNASPHVLSIMVGHLLGNACHFTERGHIEVHVDSASVRIRDTGIGMSPEILQRAYDPFYRADQFNATGKGMGLSIVRRLGDRFGWPVTLASTPGIGTEAVIAFPQVLEDASDPSRVVSTAASAAR